MRSAVIFLLAVTACTSPIGVTVTERGSITMRGAVTPDDIHMNSTSFRVSGSGRECTGTIRNWGHQPSTTFPVTCGNQRGTATIARSPVSGPIAGSGTITLQNGQTMAFVFGGYVPNL